MKYRHILTGSSPRVWGQVKMNGISIPKLRIIPTRVGTSKNEWDKYPEIEDHPHACGDKRALDTFFTPRWGSSPRVWGQEQITQAAQGRARIIPTRVGTRPNATPHSTRKEDHPHACGDKWKRKLTSRKWWGSSPRVWGQEVEEI